MSTPFGSAAAICFSRCFSCSSRSWTVPVTCPVLGFLVPVAVDCARTKCATAGEAAGLRPTEAIRDVLASNPGRRDIAVVKMISGVEMEVNKSK